MDEKVLIWIFFTVAIALIPLIFDRISGSTPTWKDFLGNGQLLLIGVALSAGSIGELLSLEIDYSSKEMIVLGSTFITVVSSSFMYPLCSQPFSIIIKKSGSVIGKRKLLIPTEIASPILFLSSLITSIQCQLISINHTN